MYGGLSLPRDARTALFLVHRAERQESLMADPHADRETLGLGLAYDPGPLRGCEPHGDRGHTLIGPRDPGATSPLLLLSCHTSCTRLRLTTSAAGDKYGAAHHQ